MGNVDTGQSRGTVEHWRQRSKASMARSRERRHRVPEKGIRSFWLFLLLALSLLALLVLVGEGAIQP